MINVKRGLSALVIMAFVAGCGGAAQEGAEPSGLQRVSVPTAPLAGASDPDQPVSSDKTPPADQTAAGPAKTTEPEPAQPAATEPAQPPQQPAPVQGSDPAPANPPREPRRLEFSTMQRGTYSGVSEQMAILISDAEGWNRHWRTHASMQVPIPATPPVDFSQKSILAIYMGEKQSGGYGLEVLDVQEENGTLTVRIRQIAPDPGDMVTMALTQPYQIVQIPKVAAGTKLNLVWE